MERLNLTKDCILLKLEPGVDIASFSCGDADLDDFFHNDAVLYDKQMLGKTYIFSTKEIPSKVVAAFTLSNDSIKSALIPNASRNKIQRKIPNVKRTRSYPASLVGRLGVSEKFRRLNVGSQVLDYIKYLFTRDENVTGCRFILVDAYNAPSVLNFYTKNGFKPIYASEEQEKEAFHIDITEKMHSRMLYFDLMQFKAPNSDN